MDIDILKMKSYGDIDITNLLVLLFYKTFLYDSRVVLATQKDYFAIVQKRINRVIHEYANAP